MTTRRLLRAAVACAALLAVPAWATTTPVERSDPRHLPPVPPGGYDLPLAPPVVRFPLPAQWVTIRSDQDWRQAGGRVEKKLSDACAVRNFVQDRPMRFRAVFKGEVMGVAFGHGLNLKDPDKLADPKMIYLFRNGDSSGCTVIAMPNEDPAVSGNGNGNGNGNAGAPSPNPPPPRTPPPRRP